MVFLINLFRKFLFRRIRLLSHTFQQKKELYTETLSSLGTLNTLLSHASREETRRGSEQPSPDSSVPPPLRRPTSSNIITLAQDPNMDKHLAGIISYQFEQDTIINKLEFLNKVYFNSKSPPTKRTKLWL